MSECVVRMEMPKGCGSCPIANFGYCSINHKKVGDPLMGYPENRPASCPIIYFLPEGHGRLVDADGLMELMLERKRPLVGADNSKDRYRYIQWLADFNAIRDAKTIIPADEYPAYMSQWLGKAISTERSET